MNSSLWACDLMHAPKGVHVTCQDIKGALEEAQKFKQKTVKKGTQSNQYQVRKVWDGFIKAGWPTCLAKELGRHLHSVGFGAKPIEDRNITTGGMHHEPSVVSHGRTRAAASKRLRKGLQRRSSLTP